MASEAELADLYLTLRAVNAPLLRAFEESTTAGESMVTALDTMFARIDAMLARTAESAAALRTELAGVGEAGAGASGAGAGTAVAGAAEGAAAGAATTGAGVAAEAEAAAVSAASAEEVAAWDRVLAAMAEVRAETAVTAQADATEWSAMATKISAENEALIASTKAYGDTVVAAGVKVDAAVAASSTVGAKLSGFANIMKLPALAAGVAGVAVVKMAADWQTATTKIVTTGGETRQAMDNLVSPTMLRYMGEFGVSAKDVTATMYKISSGGYTAANGGLNVLKAALQGGRMEGADFVTAADAVTDVLKDYNLSGLSASLVMSKLVQTTALGKTTLGEMAASMHSVIPVAAAMHIPLQDILGAFAEMTTHGMSADQTTQNLAHSLSKMQTTTKPMRDELAQVGISATDLSDSLGTKGLTGTLESISQAILTKMGPAGKVVLSAFNQSKTAAANFKEAIDKAPASVATLANQMKAGTVSYTDYQKAIKALPADQYLLASSMGGMWQQANGFTNSLKNGSPQIQSYAQAMQAATGDATTYRTALMLTNENYKDTAANVAKIGSVTADASGDVNGWAEVQSNFNQKMAEAKGGLEALGVSVGQKLLPVVTKIAGVVANASTWLTKHGQVATILAGIIGGVLVVAIAAYTAKILWSIGETAVGFVIDIAKGTWWVATKIGQFLAVSGSASAEAFATAGRWLYANGTILASEAADGAVWVATAVKNYVAVSASAVIQAAKTAAAWLASNAKLAGQALASLGTWAAETAARYSAVAVAAGVSAGKATAAWLANAATMGGQVLTSIKAMAASLVDLAKTMAVAMVNGGKAMATALVETVAPALVSAATAAWGFTIALLANPVTWIVLGIVLLGAAIYLLITHWKEVSTFLTNAWHAFTKWAKGIWDDVAGFFKDLWNKISGFFKDGWNRVWGWIKDQWDKSVHRDVAVWIDIGKFFSNLWKNVKKTFEDGWHNLWNWVKDQWDQGIHKDVAVWLDISKFFQTLWTNIKNWVQDKVREIVTGLKQEWNDFLNFWKGVGDGIKNKAQDAWNAVLDFLKGIPGKVKGFFSDAGRWLADAGKAILNGLLGGLKDAWGAVTGFIGGIGNWISSHKGPIEVDRQLLTPHGNAIMQGLLTGLQAGGRHVTSYLDDFTSSLGAGAAMSGTITLGGGGASGMAVGGSGGGITVNVYVAGSVSTENQLVRAVQQGILQLSGRNSGFGLANAFQ